MRLISGYQNTKPNHEDFALTPYLFMVYAEQAKVYGIGICWGFYSIFIGIGFNVPDNYPFFNIIK